ncbi:MAG: phosphatase PAP2 family protein [Paludibacteraceae bacterium]|nr:phosphatase PAP2 family protein [Paludibacteraceae bacterium]
MFCIGLGICIGIYDKIQMHLWLNGTHTHAGDVFFACYTHVGEWVPYVIVALLLFYKAGWASFLLIDVLLSGLIGQGLKYWADTDRPYMFFANHAPDIQLQFVEGVSLSKWYSFPSGHTVTFFALFMTLTVLLCEISCKNTGELRQQNTGLSRRSPDSEPTASRQRADSRPTVDRHSTDTRSTLGYALINLFCFLLALLGGYSRIYLNQHFAEDILGGAVIGVIVTFALLYAVPKLENTTFWNWNLIHRNNNV